MEDIVDNKLVRMIENDRVSMISDCVSSLNHADIVSIATQFGGAAKWDPLVKEIAGTMISYMGLVLDEYEGAEGVYWDTPEQYDEYVEAFHHLFTRGREEFDGELWFEVLKPNRVYEAVNEALDKFWEHIAKKFPEIKGGDFDYTVDSMVDKVMTSAVEHWLDVNGDNNA